MKTPQQEMIMTTLLSNEIQAAHAWSLLSKTPVIVYNEPHNVHLVYWNGVSMTKTYAMLIISTLWLKIWHISSIKEAAWEEYNRAYRAGAFGHREWDDILKKYSHNDMPRYFIHAINKNDEKFLFSLTETYTPAQAMEWLDPRCSRIVSGDLA